MLFDELQITGWQQFAVVAIKFHKRLTVLTGANGSGKTTVLRFLARHFGGWSIFYLRTPRPPTSSGFKYWISTLLGNPEAKGPDVIGSVAYDDGQKSAIRLPSHADAASYELTIDRPAAVQGFFIPSHRQEFRYQRVGHIALSHRVWKTTAFNTVYGTMRGWANGNAMGSSPVFQMKETLVALAHFGYDSKVVIGDPEARKLFEGFQEILRTVLPPDLGFRGLTIRDLAEVVVQSQTGEFLIDAVSGGIGALIELSWHIYMYTPERNEPFCVVIDEPENHLHASMQRQLLPNFLKAFPRAQFIVATHSPLVVGSVRDSNVYALRFNSNNLVNSIALDLYDKSGAAEDILREVLGVGVTMPIWAEEALAEILNRYLHLSLSPEVAQKLRQEMVDSGLIRWLPEALSKIADEQRP
jgi:hypothetical protein